MIKILILEDNKELAQILIKALKKKDRKIFWTSSLKDLYKITKREKPDISILDRLVEDGDSIDSIEYLKEISPNTKHIFLTQQKRIIEKIICLEKGADDYLIKPFSLAELRIKVRNMLNWGTIKDRVKKLELGEISFIPESGCLKTPDGEIQLRKREAELIFYLIKASGRVVSKQHLLDSLWGPETLAKKNTIDVYIKRLRKKMGKYQELIKTRRGFGYQLIPYKKE
jgi:two-component system response regulator ArlR